MALTLSARLSARARTSAALMLPAAFLLTMTGALALRPALSARAAYVFMVLAPVLAALAAAWRARTEERAARLGWCAVALALVVWSAGAFGNLWHELILGDANEMYRSSMLGFNLATVPLTFLLATDWQSGSRPFVRSIDGALALALGYLYFLVTWDIISDRAMPQDVGVAYLVWLKDAQDLYLALGAALRWYAAETPAERDLFRAVTFYSAAFLALVALNDHYFAGDPAFGPQYGCLIVLAFALLAAMALQGPRTAAVRAAPPRHVRGIRGASPILLALALLVVSLFLIRVNYAYGCAGVLLAVVGYGLRNTVIQVGHIEHGDILRRQRSELQAIAWTDALTGVANRHYLDQALRRAWRSERRVGGSLGVLMIDIDYFKRLNDRYGHPVGDACLRAVARVLQANLARPDDVLARYGGEEFIVLLRNVDMAGATAVAERLHAAVRDLSFEHRDSPAGTVSVSVGVTSAVLRGDTAPDQLVHAADRALYEAKCAGRNQVCSRAPAAA